MKHVAWGLAGMIVYSTLTFMALYFNPNMTGHGPVGAGIGLLFLYLIAAAGIVGLVIGGAGSFILRKNQRRPSRIILMLMIVFLPLLYFLLKLY